MMYGQETLAIKEVKVALNSKELKKWVLENKNENSEESLVAKGRTDKRGSGAGGGKCISRSKSKSRIQKCFQCQEEGHFKKDFPKRRGKEKRKNFWFWRNNYNE